MTFVERMQAQWARRVYEIANLTHNAPTNVMKVLHNAEGYATQLTISDSPSDKKALRHRPLLHHRLLEFLLFGAEIEDVLVRNVLIGTSPAGKQENGNDVLQYFITQKNMREDEC